MGDDGVKAFERFAAEQNFVGPLAFLELRFQEEGKASSAWGAGWPGE